MHCLLNTIVCGTLGAMLPAQVTVSGAIMGPNDLAASTGAFFDSFDATALNGATRTFGVDQVGAVATAPNGEFARAVHQVSTTNAPNLAIARYETRSRTSAATSTPSSARTGWVESRLDFQFTAARARYVITWRPSTSGTAALDAEVDFDGDGTIELVGGAQAMNQLEISLPFSPATRSRSIVVRTRSAAWGPNSFASGILDIAVVPDGVDITRIDQPAGFCVERCELTVAASFAGGVDLSVIPSPTSTVTAPRVLVVGFGLMQTPMLLPAMPGTTCALLPSLDFVVPVSGCTIVCPPIRVGPFGPPGTPSARLYFQAVELLFGRGIAPPSRAYEVVFR